MEIQDPGKALEAYEDLKISYFMDLLKDFEEFMKEFKKLLEIAVAVVKANQIPDRKKIVLSKLLKGLTLKGLRALAETKEKDSAMVVLHPRAFSCQIIAFPEQK